MKRVCGVFFAVFITLLILSPKILLAKVYTNPAQETVMGSGTEQISQPPQIPETERTQQLMEIWKDHVKTLTRERDEAYKEIEALKSQRPGVSPNNASQGMSDAERESVNRTNSALRSQVDALQSENQQLKLAQPRDVASVDQDLRTELTTLRSENQKIKMAIKENTESSADKEVILREKEEALRQLEYLKDKMTLLQKKYDQLQSDNQNSRSSTADLSEQGATASQLKSLQAKAEKLKIVENDLQEARDTFASYIRELETKNRQITEENNSLKSRLISPNSN